MIARRYILVCGTFLLALLLYVLAIGLWLLVKPDRPLAS
jgi:hypothetical protein